MSLLKFATNQEALEESKWFTYGEEDGSSVRIKIRPYGRTAIAKVEKLIKNRDYIKGLNLDWDKLPKGSDERRENLRNFVIADTIIEAWENVGDQDGLALECDFYAKAWAFESIEFSLWCLRKASSLAGEVAEEEAKN